MIRITEIQSASEEEWQKAWETCAYSCFSHSPEWTAMWSACYFGAIAPVCKKLTFSDGATAILVLSEKKVAGNLLSVFESAVQHGYGGLLSSDHLEKSHFQEARAYAQKHFPTLIWRCNPFSEEDVPFTGAHVKEDYTYAVNLMRDSDELQEQLTQKKIATKVRAAERKGLRLAQLSEDQLPLYLELYENAISRWKSQGKSVTRYPDQIFEAFIQSDFCDFQGVWRHDELICAGPMLKSNVHVVSWLALAKTEALALKPYEFLYYHVIFEYKNKGFHWFDFHPSGGNPGVDRFKERFATDILPAPVLIQESIIYKAARALKRS